MDMTKMEALHRGGFDAFRELAGRWELSTEEAMGLLGVKSVESYARWCGGKDVDIPNGVFVRASLLFGIDKSLQKLFFGRPGSAKQWLRQKGSASLFPGQSPIEVMMSGGQDNVMAILTYLQCRVQP